MVYNPKNIAQGFKEYYESLYQLERKPSPENAKKKWEAARDYIKETGMPRLTEEIARELDAPITTEAVMGGSKTFETGQGAGPRLVHPIIL